MHKVTRYKDGGHAILSDIFENPMLHANFMALCYKEPVLLLIEILHRGNKIFNLSCYPMTLTLTR